MCKKDNFVKAKVDKPTKPKEKRRNNEKRKEKSRDAARCRRSRETEIFTELANLLPLRNSDVEQLDKASVMRLAIAYLKTREMVDLMPNVKEGNPTERSVVTKTDPMLSEININENVYLQALDGFLLVLSSDGDITYVSENFSEYLGINQIDMMGNQIWDYMHQCDHDDLKDILSGGKRHTQKPDKSTDLSTVYRTILLRIKCTLTSRGRSVNIKSASYKVIQLSGHVVTDPNDVDKLQFVAVGRPIPHPANIEIPLCSNIFLTKHSLDMKYVYVDEIMQSLLGYKPDDLLGKSLYNCYHGMDSTNLLSTFKNVLSKGQAETDRYRYLAKTGGYLWVITQATLVYDKQKPQSVVCVNYIVSNIENETEIYSCDQWEACQNELTTGTIIAQSSPTISSSTNECDDDSLVDDNNFVIDVATGTASIASQLSPSDNNAIDLIRDQLIEAEIEIINQSPIIFDSLLSSTVSSAPNKSIIGKDTICPPRSVTATVLALNNTNPSSVPNNTTSNRVSSLTEPLSISIGSITPPQQSSPTTSSSTNVQSQSTRFTSNTTPTTVPIPHQSRPQTVTASIITPISSLGQQPARKTFTPRTDTMKKGFLMLPDEGNDKKSMKEEPDDLTHLAPTAGDTFVSLDESSAPFFGEMFDGFMLPDVYDGTFLNDDDINSWDSSSVDQQPSSPLQTPSTKNCGMAIDPFLNYRDDNSSLSPDHLMGKGIPNLLLSPIDNDCLQSRESSIPSLCSPNSLSQDDEFALMTMGADEDLELSMRAPYIPMNENDDLPLLTEDLMWSTFSDELTLHHKSNNYMVSPATVLGGGGGDTDKLNNTERSVFTFDTELDGSKSTIKKDNVTAASNRTKYNPSPKIELDRIENDSKMDRESSLAALLTGNEKSNVPSIIMTTKFQPNNHCQQSNAKDSLLANQQYLTNGQMTGTESTIDNSKILNNDVSIDTWPVSDFLTIPLSITPNQPSPQESKSVTNPKVITAISPYLICMSTPNSKPSYPTTTVTATNGKKYCTTSTTPMKTQYNTVNTVNNQRMIPDRLNSKRQISIPIPESMSSRKRLKTGNHQSVIISTIPNTGPPATETTSQLLQQLMMNPLPNQSQVVRLKGEQQQVRGGNDNDNKLNRRAGDIIVCNANRISNGKQFNLIHNQDRLKINGTSTADQQNKQLSNSVLKNLLVSGCDVNAGYICIEPMRFRKATKA